MAIFGLPRLSLSLSKLNYSFWLGLPIAALFRSGGNLSFSLFLTVKFVQINRSFTIFSSPPPSHFTPKEKFWIRAFLKYRTISSSPNRFFFKKNSVNQIDFLPFYIKHSSHLLWGHITSLMSGAGRWQWLKTTPTPKIMKW